MKCTNIFLGKLLNTTTPFVDTFTLYYAYNVDTNTTKAINPPQDRSFIKNTIDKPWFYLYVNEEVLTTYVNEYKTQKRKERPNDTESPSLKRNKSVGNLTQETNTQELNLPQQPTRIRSHSLDDGGTEIDPDDLSLTFSEDVFDDKKGGKRRTRKNKPNKKYKKRFRKTRSKRQRGGNQKEKDLFDAIGIYDYAKVENALNNGANVNAKNDDGDTPLIHAINSGDIDMVQLLLDHPDIDIELDVEKNKELSLAEELTPEDEEQNGIPYLIEDYIVTKNKIKEHKYKNIKQISNYKRPNISSLKTMAYHHGPSALDTHINLNPGTINRPYGKLGGKRKTQRRKKSIRKSRKNHINR